MIIESFIELFTIVMVHNILFERKKIKDILFSIIPTAIGLITCRIDFLSIILPIISITLFVKIRYKETLKNAFFKVLLSLMITMLMECIVGIIVGIFGISNKDKSLKYILLSVFTIGLIIINLLKKAINRKFIEVLRKNVKIVMLGIINIVIIMIMLKFINDNIVIDRKSIVWIFSLLIAFIVISVFMSKEFLAEIAAKRSLEVQVRCNLILDNCFKKLRESEHEYKNHLNTIYSMLEVGSDEQVRDMVKRYVNQNKDNDSLNGLMYIDNIILRAIIYSKLNEAKTLGIRMEHKINSNLKNISINEPKLVVVLTNLLTNAIEAARDSNNPLIDVSTNEDIVDGIKKYTIEVKNTANDVNSIDISSMFKQGYSSKNEDRGYGLYNVSKIVNENNGYILVEIEDNMLSITVEV